MIIITKQKVNIFIFIISLLCLFIQPIQGKNANCTQNIDAIYYRNFDSLECITKEVCSNSTKQKNVYLTGSNVFLCNNNDTYCKTEYKNNPGYQRKALPNYTECTLCPKDKPVSTFSNGRFCDICPGDQIFSYIQLEGQTGACVDINEILKQIGTLLDGVLSFDKKFLHEQDYVCPQNQKKQQTVYKYQNNYQFLQKCSCPLETPLLNNEQICVKSCPEETPLSDGIKCLNYCPNGEIYVNFETKKCLSTCPNELYADREIYPDSKFYYCYKQCPTGKLHFISPENGFKECIKENECTLKISLDKTQCTSDCGAGQVAFQKDSLMICQDTGQDRCEKKYNFTHKDYKICSDTCNYFMINKDGFEVCSSECTGGNFIQDQNNGEQFRKCSETCNEDFNYTGEKNVKYCMKKCPKLTYQFIDDKKQQFCIKQCDTYVYTVSDQEVCKGSCENTDYVLEQVKGETFRRCSTDCNGHEYDNGDKIKRCYEKCPNNQIFDRNKKKCLNSKKDCETYYSLELDQCVAACDSKKFEYPIQMEGFKQCFTCNGYYNSVNQSCSLSCGLGQIGIPSLHQCLPQENGKDKCTSSTLQGLNFKLSSDQTICTEFCQYPEIENSEGCKSPCKIQDSSCNVCKEKQYILETGNKQVCTDSCGGELFISSDKKRCIKHCSLIKEKQPSDNSKICIKCNENEILIPNSDQQNPFICKTINTAEIFSDKLKFIQTQLKSQIDSITSLLSIKDLIADLAKDAFKKAQETKDNPPQKFIDEVINLSNTTISNIGITELKNIPHKIGSKDNIIVYRQNKQSGYKFKSNLDIDQILNNNNYSFMESITNEQDEIDQLPFLIATIMPYHPYCQNEKCQIYPLIQLNYTDTQNKRLLLEKTQQFTVTFNITNNKDYEKYICISYDLNKTNDTPYLRLKTMINDNKQIQCFVNSGSITLLYDQNCQYVNKQICRIENNNDNSNNEDSDSADSNNNDELNTGQIVGIIIGCIAFLGLVLVGIFYMIKIKKSKNQNKYFLPQNNINNLQLKSNPNIAIINTLPNK